MLVVGLTGGIASGKSTVSKRLREEHHLPIIDLDVLAREVVAPGSRALQLIAARFGAARVLLPDGSLNRKALGEVVFSDTKERKWLEGVTHPRIRKRMAWEIVKAWARGERVCVVDAPLLVEAGLWKWAGQVVLIYCSEPLQMQRMITRDSLPADQARARLSSQRPLASKLAYADTVLDNSGAPRELHEQVDRMVARWRAQTAGWWVLSWLVPGWAVLSAIATVAWRRVGWWRRQGRGRRREE